MNNHIKHYRTKLGLTQEQLAEMTDVTRQTILSIEKGKFDPSLSLAFDLAKILKIPIDKLFDNR